MSTWQIIQDTVKDYDLYRLREFVSEDSMGHETLHVDTLNQGERTFIYEYIDCAETKMHAEVIRRIITTPGFQINRSILNRPNVMLLCLRFRASIEILRILIQHPDFDINTKSCCGECKDCGECTIMKGYVLFAR